MKILIADHNKSTISSIKECSPFFDVEEGDPLAFDIDAVVSPANTKGIMNGGYDAVLRRYFGVVIEYTVQEYLKKFKIDVGQAIAVKTGHPKVHWLIVTPTVSVTGEGFSGHESVSYACAYNAVRVAHERGVKYLGMTGLGSGVGSLDRRVSARQQVEGIQDAVNKFC
ncbi:macro domain-containing protein [Pseudomonadota bacterium]|nr:macro domain-containing protein [Pseudomonadota bacterium]